MLEKIAALAAAGSVAAVPVAAEAPRRAAIPAHVAARMVPQPPASSAQPMNFDAAIARICAALTSPGKSPPVACLPRSGVSGEAALAAVCASVGAELDPACLASGGRARQRGDAAATLALIASLAGASGYVIGKAGGDGSASETPDPALPPVGGPPDRSRGT